MKTKEELNDLKEEDLAQVSGGVITTAGVGKGVPDSELVDGTPFVGDGYVYDYGSGFRD